MTKENVERTYNVEFTGYQEGYDWEEKCVILEPVAGGKMRFETVEEAVYAFFSIINDAEISDVSVYDDDSFAVFSEEEQEEVRLLRGCVGNENNYRVQFETTAEGGTIITSTPEETLREVYRLSNREFVPNVRKEGEVKISVEGCKFPDVCVITYGFCDYKTRVSLIFTDQVFEKVNALIESNVPYKSLAIPEEPWHSESEEVNTEEVNTEEEEILPF